MDDRTFDTAYYERSQQRLRRLVVNLQDRLSPADRALVDEFIDANECGLALETIVDGLVEDGVRLDATLLDEIDDLAETMRLSPNLVDRLTSPVGG